LELTISLFGKIDRIDERNGEVRIIDFWLPLGEHRIRLSEQDSSGKILSWDLGTVKVLEEKKGKIFLNTFVP
jgi:hypothetical protein